MILLLRVDGEYDVIEESIVRGSVKEMKRKRDEAKEQRGQVIYWNI